MRISIVGTGYVGLVSGACLAARGHDVVCIDKDARKVASINAGQAPIYEVGLPQLLSCHVGRQLKATTDLAAAVAESQITLIAVGTPATDGKIDLRQVEGAATEIGVAIGKKSGYHTVVVKSTVISGTTDGPVRRALEAASGKVAGRDFGLGMNPEFLTEGTAVEDFMKPDRIVLGGIDERTRDVLAAVYESFKDTPFIRTNNTTAEMIKYASNALLATMISFANEFGRLCTAVGGVDIADVMKGVHASAYLTSRLGDGRSVTAPIAKFLEAGCGFGGSCLPKDVTALIAQGAHHDRPMQLLASVLDINRTQPDEMLQLITRHHKDLRDIKVSVLGLAFKQDTDDVRESPAFPVIKRLREQGATVTAYDPIVRAGAHPQLEGVHVVTSLREALADAAVVALITRWDEFQQTGAVLRELGRSPLVVDGRRCLNPADFANYEGIGC